LGTNSIGQEGALALANTLLINSTLECLDLEWNSVGDWGAALFARALEGNSTLKKLVLGANAIGHTGFVAISKALESNKALASLDLTLNSGDVTKAAVILAQGLRSNRSLAELHLNSIGPEGTQAMKSCHLFAQPIDRVIQTGHQPTINDVDGILHNWRILSCTLDRRRRLPLHCAADANLRWIDGTREIVEANYLALGDVDAVTGLYPFMLAAVGECSDYCTVFRMLQCHPGLIHGYII